MHQSTNILRTIELVALSYKGSGYGSLEMQITGKALALHNIIMNS